MLRFIITSARSCIITARGSEQLFKAHNKLIQD